MKDDDDAVLTQDKCISGWSGECLKVKGFDIVHIWREQAAQSHAGEVKIKKIKYMIIMTKGISIVIGELLCNIDFFFCIPDLLCGG